MPQKPQSERSKKHEEGGYGKGRIIALAVLAIIATLMFFGNAKSSELSGIDSVTMNYAQESIEKFVEVPNSINLHRVGGVLFFSIQMPTPVWLWDMFSRYADVGDEYAFQTFLLLANTIWFTDYVLESPKFSYGVYLFQYDRELPGKEQWHVSDNNGLNTEMTWGQIVCLVMNIDYDPAYDYSLIAQKEYVLTNPEDHLLFIGPHQRG